MEVASRTTAENTVNHRHGGSRKPPSPAELQHPGTVTTLVSDHALLYKMSLFVHEITFFQFIVTKQKEKTYNTRQRFVCILCF